MSATLDGFRKQTARGIVLAVCGIALLAVLAACVQFGDRGRLPSTLTGRVSGPSGPVAGAIVQLQGTATQVRTDAAGRFTLHGQGLGGSQAVTVTAWAESSSDGAAWIGTSHDPIHSPAVALAVRVATTTPPLDTSMRIRCPALKTFPTPRQKLSVYS